LGLEQAASEADVHALFRNNKNIFDRMKAEPGSDSYEELMSMFKAAKAKLAANS
jgi:hypothetical protein